MFRIYALFSAIKTKDDKKGKVPTIWKLIFEKKKKKSFLLFKLVETQKQKKKIRKIFKLLLVLRHQHVQKLTHCLNSDYCCL